ncbi:nuclear transport factor 2 family protein [Streptomyces sp. KL116D]|uniref:nuclear transport factor 2 family protein n=1 Tax=Streptomyces sp. KL116D TaxID=3045152 RepID=UPI0035563A90
MRARRHRTRPGGLPHLARGSRPYLRADRRTGAAPSDLGPLFAALDQDPPQSLDAVHDRGPTCPSKGTAAGTRRPRESSRHAPPPDTTAVSRAVPALLTPRSHRAHSPRRGRPGGHPQTHHSYLDAMVKADTPTLDGLLDGGFTLTHMTGYAQPKTEWLAGIRAGQFVYHSIDETDTILDLDDSTARLTLRTMTDATVHGSRSTWQLQLITDYAHRDDTWIP